MWQMGLQTSGLPEGIWYVRGSVEVEELLDLKFGGATLVVAVKEEDPARSVEDLAGKKIATEFPCDNIGFFQKGTHTGDRGPGRRCL